MQGKLFADANVDESLQYLLPDVPPDSWYSEDTYDEDGLLHSFNDVPIFVKQAVVIESYSLGAVAEFQWYSHGEISRAGDKPPIVVIKPDEYLTLNEDVSNHSYNGMPSIVKINAHSKTLSLEWYSNGVLNKEDGLPAKVFYNLDGSLSSVSYYVDGLAHRSNGLPSLVSEDSKIWNVQGVFHNAAGAAHFFPDDDNIVRPITWCLYGVKMPESFFYSVKELEADNGIPLYVAFLVSMRIISMEHLDAFTDDAGVWKTDVPAAWVLRALNVTAENFSEKILAAESWNPEIGFPWYVDPDGKEFKDFMSVIASEDADAVSLLEDILAC